jgi:hypothetical protein
MTDAPKRNLDLFADTGEGLGVGWCPECNKFARIVRSGYDHNGYYHVTDCKKCGRNYNGQ